MSRKIIPHSLILVICLTACTIQAPVQPTPQSTSTTAVPLTKLRLPMHYIPNVQFAPFYVAVEKGYFAAEGIQIEFDYAFETNGVTLVGAGELPFSVASGEQVLLARAQGLPVVYVFATYQNFPVSVMAKAEQNIHSPADLRGKKIGLPSLLGAPYIGVQALLFSAGLTTSDVTLDAIGFTQVEALVTNREQAVVGYSNNEPIQLRAKGYQITELRVADFAELAADGIISSEKTIAENPTLVRGMVRAMTRGVNDTISYPDEAYTICLKYVENLSQADQAVQMEVLKTSIEFWRAERVGFSKTSAWTEMNDLLLKMGLLDHALDVNAAFTNEFVP